MIEQLFNNIFQLILLFLNPIILILIIIFACIYYYKNKKYKEETYYKLTNNDFFNVRHNAGRYGEYLTYKYLKEFENQGARFLFNIYIPKKYEETTEIDVLMISSKGLFVFESKNYSGWVFGSDYQKYWYQTLPSGRRRSYKKKFYNPVFQNNTHVRYLKSLIGDNFPIYSIITFSDHCTLMNVNIKYSKVNVINCYEVNKIVSTIYANNPADALSNEQIDEIYNFLYPYTQVDDIAKQNHIENINRKIKGNNINAISALVDDKILQDEDINNTVEIIEINSDTENRIEQDNNLDDNILINENIGKETNNETLICPECGAKLSLKTARYGEHAGETFYGCSNYPQCKYIQKNKF